MSYKLYIDKNEIFVCKISLDGASMINAESRILVTTSNLNLMFEGDIDKDGNCSIPIKKLKGLLGENDKGKIERGFSSNLIVLDKLLNIKEVYLYGNLIS